MHSAFKIFRHWPKVEKVANTAKDLHPATIRSAITVASLAMSARTAGRRKMAKEEKAEKEAKVALLQAKNVTTVAAIT